MSFILSGDFCQSQPVDISTENIEIIKNVLIPSICNAKMHLKINKRITNKGDIKVKFQDTLWSSREGGRDFLTDGSFKQMNNILKTNICYTNKKRKEINKLCMEHFKPDDAVSLETR